MPTCAIVSQRSFVSIDIVLDADWEDPMPTLTQGGEPLDLTGKILELFVRPVYDYATLIVMLSSEDDPAFSSIRIDDAAAGLATIYMPRNELIAAVPSGIWDHFLILKEPAGGGDADGFLITELWRGQLLVRPGRVTL